MAKLARQFSKTKKLSAMTLVEVLVALAIVSFVFSSLIQMTFDALTRAKKLELQDKMRNYATEATQIIYNKKDTNWALFSKTSIPPSTVTATSQAYINYTTDFATGAVQQIDIATITAVNCFFDSTTGSLTGSCNDTMPPADAEKKMFGRLLLRRDEGDNENEMKLDIVVACLEKKCDPKQFPPFVLNLSLYRTGGSQ